MSWAMAARHTATAASGNYASPGRYTAPRMRPFSLAAAVAIGGGLVSAVAWLGADRPPVTRIEQRLVVMDLMAPPPPPSTPAEAAPVKTAAIIAPPPLVAPPILPTLSAAAIVPEPTPRTVEESHPAPDPVRPAAPPAPAAPATATDTDLSATMIAARPPSYPTLSRRNREQGIVTLAVRLSLDGQVDAVSIARSSGFERLDKAALAAVKHWRWSPTMREGRAVAVAGLVRMPFVLRT